MTAAARPATPQAKFTRIARRYDLVNAVLSARRDRTWRRATARALPLAPGARVLDVATGTGALALALVEHAPGADVIGIDRNQAMLDVARARSRSAPALRLVRAAAEDLPFADASFDAVSIGFAIDDLADRERAARELVRVLRPGGTVALLELAMPERPPLRWIYQAALGVFPVVDRLIAGNGSLVHLREEIMHYRGRAAIAELWARVGLHGHEVRALSGGIAVLHVARKAV
jgi:demethylmenaquinone methyltransferase/2-methoxy-6-polyprenyl-1,4-benzoquinol methylase